MSKKIKKKILISEELEIELNRLGLNSSSGIMNLIHEYANLADEQYDNKVELNLTIILEELKLIGELNE